MQYHLRLAIPEDATIIARLRIDLLLATGELQESSDLSAFELRTTQYLIDAITNDAYIGWVAKSGEKIVGMGGVNVFRRLPSPANLTGEEWYLLNMYTLPAYRGLAIGLAITQAAITHAETLGVRRIWLDTTDVGRSVYEKAGFASMGMASAMEYIVS